MDFQHSLFPISNPEDGQPIGRQLRLLVTGNRGYIGSHLDLEGEGCDWKDRKDYRDIAGESFDVVVHLAASVSVTESFKAPAEYFRNNAFGVAEFLERNKVGRFVFVSTGGAMYGNRILAKETDPEQYESPYACSKFVAESYVRAHPNSCILRLANVYGGDSTIRGEAAVHARFATDDPILVYGGWQTRDFIHIVPVVEAIKRAAFGNMVGTFNIGSGTETKIVDIAREYGRSRDVSVWIEPARPGEVEHISLDCTAAKIAGLLD